MTTLTSKISSFQPKNLIILLGFFFLVNGAFAQLDSAAIDSVYFTQEIVQDSTGANDTLDIMNVQVSMNDVDFMGEVLVTVYDQASNYPMQMLKRTKAELDTNGLIVGDTVTIEFLGLPATSGSYSIEVQVRNFQGGNLPLVTTTY